MDILGGLYLGMTVAMDPWNLVFCLAGCLIGTLVGVLPGLGPTATIAILLPATFSMPPVTGLITLAGIYYGAQYGGSITSILLRLPGEASSVVTVIDGHAMTRNGRGGAALAISAWGSFVAGTIATAFIALLAPVVINLVIGFGAAEYFMLMVVGLIACVVLANGSIARAVAMILLGLLLGMVGTDVNRGVLRFNFGFNELAEGIPFVPVVVGLFGIAEILVVLERAARGQSTVATISPVSSLWPTRREVRQAAPAVLRGTGIGLILGMLPGGGALLASFVAYAAEKKLSRNPERFGKGAVEGVAAPESANNAGAQTAFIPLLTLGLPTNAIMALIIGTMMIHGVNPGPRVISTQPQLFWGVVVSMWIGNVMLLIINLPMVRLWVQLLKIPYHVLYPIILAMSIIGVYSVNYRAFDVYAALLFAFFGYALNKWRCEAAPFVLAFILGPMMEEYFRRTLLLSDGDFTVFVTRPVSLALSIVAVGLLAIVVLPGIKTLRRTAFAE